MRRKILVISPSGNFYGSEQVLLDYLKNTGLGTDVMAPAGSMFLDILLAAGLRHQIKAYNSRKLYWFYCKVIWWFILGRYDVLYLNEAGHNRYIHLLARIFKGKKFVIHVRMREDTEPSRWKKPCKNIQLISISRYIQDLLPMQSILLYDAFIFSNKRFAENKFNASQPLRIGVIGRISGTKGVHEINGLLDIFEKRNPGSFQFLLFGDVSPDMKGTETLQRFQDHQGLTMMGFIKVRQEIYSQVDVVLHLSKTEALGRIFFEAIDEAIPFVGYDIAGIGEIGHLTGLQELLLDPVASENSLSIYEKLKTIRSNYIGFVQKVFDRKQAANDIFNIEKYTSTLDQILTS